MAASSRCPARSAPNAATDVTDHHPTEHDDVTDYDPTTREIDIEHPWRAIGRVLPYCLVRRRLAIVARSTGPASFPDLWSVANRATRSETIR